MTFQTILTKYRNDSFSERDKGDRFERLMQAYLKTDPQYAYRFKNVWLWKEFPIKLHALEISRCGAIAKGSLSWR